jgi:cytochrome P450
LLYRLVRAADDDDHPLTTEQLRDQVLTFLLAGHETTGLALTWALHLVNHDPEVLECVQADIGGQLGDRRAGAEDVEALERTRAVLLEAMRLYPPLWAMGRQAEREMELLGWKVPRGALVVMPQVVVHRDPRWFAEPESFRPWRWLGRDGRALPDFAYFPFGGGPRTCIGNHFALMEATLVLATLLQHVVPTARSPEAVGVRPAMTLHPKEPIRVQVNKRA